MPAPVDSTLTELAPLLASGALTAETLLDACLARIAAHDRVGAELRAFIRLDPRATDEAQCLDRERAARGARGPLHGIPLVLKDNIDLAGLPTTSGSVALTRAVALRDAGQTERLRRAGAVIVGKTNLSELSFEVRSRSSVAGDVRNPFNLAVTAGGSSGGTAAAIAAGFAVAGLGTDTGGSIRIPAAFNGLIGLRPTQGLLDLRGVAPLAPSADTIGPIGRCVADVACLFDCMLGEKSSPRLPAFPGQTLLRDARIGVLRQAFGEDEAIREALEHALTLMVEAGATLVDPLLLPENCLPRSARGGGGQLVDWEFRVAFDAYLQSNFARGTAPRSLAQLHAEGSYLPEYAETLGRRLAVTSLQHAAYRDLLAEREGLRRRLAALMAEHGLTALVYPTSVVTPVSLENPASGWAAELAACTGWPAITLPVGRAPSGPPIGLELLGQARRDVELLSLAADLESRSDGRMIPELEPVEGLR